ncbi:hypothetical protein DFAR_1470038 [Desulfarculales bacterium]
MAACNWDLGNVERGGKLPEETRNYLQKIPATKISMPTATAQ